MAAIGSDLYLFGGPNAYSNTESADRQIYKFDGSSWTIVPWRYALPGGGRYQTIVSIGSDLFLFGGISTFQMMPMMLPTEQISSSLWRYDNDWHTAGSGATPRYLCTLQ